MPGGGDPHQGIALLSVAGVSQKTEGGVPIALASSNGLSRVRRIAPYLWTSPWPVFEIADLDASWYLHALFGLRTRTVKFLNAVFAPHLASWLGFVEARWGSLVRDIARGSIPADLALPDTQRRAIEPLLQPDPARAAELERAAAPGFDGFVQRAWPWIRYAATVITGPFAAAVPRLRRYLGELPIHTTCLSSSEGMLGLNLELDRPDRYVLCNGCAHFEFIPAEKAHEAEPPTCDLGELERGRSYEIAITNHAGLYRYRLGDLIEVVDFHHEAPVMVFRHRLGSILDLVGEKTSEEQALSAVQAACGSANLIDYAAWGDALATPPRYVIYLETTSGALDAASLAERLDEALSSANPAYAGYRRGHHRLGPPEVRRLTPGAFQALERLRLAESPGLGHNQLKTPRRLDDERWRRFLDEKWVDQESTSRPPG